MREIITSVSSGSNGADTAPPPAVDSFIYLQRLTSAIKDMNYNIPKNNTIKQRLFVCNNCNTK
jgi:hypothetical protein